MDSLEKLFLFLCLPMPTFYHSAARSDYSRRCGSVYFPARVNEVTFNVAIRDEGLVESNETFYIDLEIPSAAANRRVTKHSPITNCNCKHENATVIIIDDDSECSSIVVCNNKKILNVHTNVIECLSIPIHSFKLLSRRRLSQSQTL